ncbi:response regulator transcription factor [Svornostia abyssi]|uniref:Response regulator transcription factor n=1 Tax=Svornostia abyssi TaxID=2898438 RepID=A0ABY5PG41_9ACTN|nr:response regulator transcription factor [Parviterribacteraceae bacterium J379]
MTPRRTILVVEDDALIADAVAARLRAEGFTVELAVDGPTGVRACERLQPALVVLDVMLPGFDGWEVCRRIQSARPVPVLMLTARDSETDLLVGLGLGADDYMTKPFSPRELVARVHAILRRADRAAAQEITAVGGLEIDAGARLVRRAGEDVQLTRTEFDLLAHLVGANGRVLSRDHLLEEVWGYADGTGPRTVDSHIAALRRKLGPDAVRTVHGVGYAIGEGTA